jgi:hypothetical protein
MITYNFGKGQYPDFNLCPTYIVSFANLAAVAGNAIQLACIANKNLALLEFYLDKPGVAINVVMRRQSTADSAGTSTTPTPVVLDTKDPAASAVVKLYTAAPTQGTLVGNLFHCNLDPAAYEKIDVRFNNGQPAVLHGAAETFAWTVDASGALTGFLKWCEW